VKKSLVVLLIGALAVGAWFYWAPRAAARDLRKAAMTGDVEELRRLVDFPLVQEQLKADLKANMMRSIDTTQSSGLAGTLAAGFGGMMVDGLVTQVVSPSGIAALVRYGRAGSSTTADTRPPELITRTRYEGLNTFVITARNAKSQLADTINFVLRRRGLSWQLVRVVVPSLSDLR
jgi:hypothetical protein